MPFFHRSDMYANIDLFFFMLMISETSVGVCSVIILSEDVQTSQDVDLNRFAPVSRCDVCDNYPTYREAEESSRMTTCSLGRESQCCVPTRLHSQLVCDL